MTTQQAQWREWYRMEFRCEPSDSPQSYAVATKIGWLAAAQKYSPTPEERAVVADAERVSKSVRGFDLGPPFWDGIARLRDSLKALHATRQPPRVDHLKEALALLDEIEEVSRKAIPTDEIRELREHLEALEASK